MRLNILKKSKLQAFPRFKEEIFSWKFQITSRNLGLKQPLARQQKRGEENNQCKQLWRRREVTVIVTVEFQQTDDERTYGRIKPDKAG